jgi:hypothetical protein
MNMILKKKEGPVKLTMSCACTYNFITDDVVQFKKDVWLGQRCVCGKHGLREIAELFIDGELIRNLDTDRIF